MTDMLKATEWAEKVVKASGSSYTPASKNAAAQYLKMVNAYEPMLAALNTIVAIMGNVDHSKGGGENAARLYGGMLMDCKEVAQKAIQQAKEQSQ